MHPQCYALFERFVRDHAHDLHGCSVLDVGSCDVNGTLRPLFAGLGTYTGCDLEAGPNVDLVQEGPYRIQLSDAQFSVVVSANCLEHCKRPWLLVLEMDRMLKPGGLLALSVPFNIAPHRFPVDCWRILPDAFEDMFGAWMSENGRKAYSLLRNYIDTIDTFVVARKPL